MKKTIICLMAICLLLTFHPLQSGAAITVSPVSSAASSPSETTEEKAMMLRLNEINAMDRSNLSVSEKSNLRNEVVSIRQHYRRGGVYISAGALIIIILLLIILL